LLLVLGSAVILRVIAATGVESFLDTDVKGAVKEKV
jgi:hypothetical protein